MNFERRIVLTAVAAFLPAALCAMVLALTGDFTPKVLWTVLAILAVGGVTATYVVREQLTYPLRTMSNLITALREEDYSLRARGAAREGALGDLMAEINALAELMESRKLEAVEASALLRAVLAQIDVAIFTFDDRDELRLVNPAGERLLALPRERMIGRTSSELGLAEFLRGEPHTVDHAFAGRAGRWDVRQSSFRERGIPHRLLVIADITRALREEEAEAWRRIVRVLGHELNNSLAPIKSIASSLERLVRNDPLPADWQADLASGMRVIGSRTDALSRFTRAYAQLARLPEPRRREVPLRELVDRVVMLETRVVVTADGPDLVIDADEDQLEQVLINLLKNAADASLENRGAVHIRWRRSGASTLLTVEDEGRGVSGTANLFVPFFTTKPHGSGIGLFLSRQIVEAHGGTLTLENRSDGPGAVATLRL